MCLTDSLYPCLLSGASTDGEPYGQTRGSARGGERSGRSGQGVYEGHRCNQPLQEHERDSW